MRSWCCGVGLVAVTAGGVSFVFTGYGNPSHCGRCLAPAHSAPAAPPAAAEPPSSPPVVEVVDVASALTPPAEPNRLPFVSFDEPPLAKRPPAPAPAVIQAAFAEPPAAELAPMPRAVGAAAVPLGSPSDPF